MTLQQLKYALTIADCGSMNEAAKQLFISQPSLSETMKELETEIGLDIFLRSNRGIVITPEGEEFLGYARQVTEQFGLLQSKYIDKKVKEKFSVSTQHYTFAVKAFVETVKQIGMEQYEFAVHETTTISVIENVKNFKSEIGVLYENDFNEKVLNKMFKENGLEFVELFSCDTFVYLWSGHPLAKQDVITMEELDEYPCLSFDQGKNNSLYLAEEMKSTYEYRRLIKANDRATLLNLMIGLNAYTLCSGIICEDLNGNDYKAVPLKETEKMRIGYIKRKGAKVSHIGELYIEEEKRTNASTEQGEAKEEIPSEESFLLEKSVRCTVCDKVFKTKMIKNGRVKRLEPDFDLRPRFMYIDTLKYDVASCPNCGYTAMNRYFEHLSSVQIKLIKEKICANFKPTGEEPAVYDYDTAINRYKLALFNTLVKKGKASEKAYTCLKISWLYRGKLEGMDEKDASLEQERRECLEQQEAFYNQAYEGFLKAVSTEMFPMCGMDQTTVDYLLAVMSKHFKRYDTASKCISRIMSTSSASKKMKDRAYDLKEEIIREIKAAKA